MRRWLTAFLVGLFVIALSSPVDFVGMFLYNGQASVGVANLTRGEIWQLNYSDAVKQYTPTLISCFFKNTGSVAYMERMEMHIENLTRTLFESHFDGFATLMPGDSKKFIVNYTPVNDTGWYIIHVNSSYAGNKNAQAWGIFQVIPYWDIIEPEPEIPSEGSPGTGTGSDGLIRAPEAGSPRAVLNYQRNIALSPGENYILPVIVENLGTSSMYDVVITAYGSGVVFNINPAYIAKIAKGSSAVFLLSISVPINAEPGIYGIDFRVSSLYETVDGHVDVSVQESRNYDYIGDMINNYLSIYTTVKQRLVALTNDGRNVSAAYSMLVDAHTHIQAARRYYDSGEYEQALRELDSGRKLLEDAIMSAEYSSIPQYRAYLPAYVSIFLLLVAVLIVISIYHAEKARRKIRRIRLERVRLKGG